MFIILSSLVGILSLVAFGFAVRKSKEADSSFCFLLATLAFAAIFTSGIMLEKSGNQFLTDLAIPDKNLYLVGSTPDVVCLIPAKLNGLTAVAEANGIPRYYAGLKMETNSGVVVAITTKSGEKVLRSFPLKMEVEE